LQHRGPQRSVENIVSMAFVMTIVMISVLSIEVGAVWAVAVSAD